jgi:hypothetical protein
MAAVCGREHLPEIAQGGACGSHWRCEGTRGQPPPAWSCRGKVIPVVKADLFIRSCFFAKTFFPIQSPILDHLAKYSSRINSLPFMSLFCLMPGAAPRERRSRDLLREEARKGVSGCSNWDIHRRQSILCLDDKGPVLLTP